jgi:hypothetical protein
LPLPRLELRHLGGPASSQSLYRLSYPGSTGACSTKGKSRSHSGDLSVDGRMDLKETEWDGMDWIDLAQDTEQWRALVNTVMNIWVP